MQLNTYITAILFLTTSLKTFGQSEISATYTRTDYPASSIVLNQDKSFKFKFHFDLQWDLVCGQYELKGDTILFHYNSDMFDVQCNSERINYTDTSGVILQDAIDKRFRPILARLSKNKLITIKTGDIKEPETIDTLIFYYKREKKREKRQNR